MFLNRQVGSPYQQALMQAFRRPAPTPAHSFGAQAAQAPMGAQGQGAPMGGQMGGAAQMGGAFAGAQGQQGSSPWGAPTGGAMGSAPSSIGSGMPSAYSGAQGASPFTGMRSPIPQQSAFYRPQ